MLNDQTSEEMIETINKQQFLSIRDIEENKKLDSIDSQIQNYSSQLIARSNQIISDNNMD